LDACAEGGVEVVVVAGRFVAESRDGTMIVPG
jgi:hypothetical protein